MKIANQSQLDTKRNVWTINVIVASFVIVGNITLPSVFWRAPQPPSFWSYPPLFLSGVLASEVAIIGIFASFTNTFYAVRWIWSLIASFSCGLLLTLGVFVAESSTVRGELGVIVTMIAVGGNLVVLGIGAGVRWALGFHFSDDFTAEQLAASKSFNLLFLFKLMIAIALIMLAVKIAPIQFTADLVPGPEEGLILLSFFTLHFLFALGLIASALAISMLMHRGKTNIAALSVLFFIGTPVVVLAKHMTIPSAMSFWLECLCTQMFYLGFISAMLIVFGLWRKAGLRLIR